MVIPHASCSNEDSEAAHRGKNQGMKKTTRHPELGSVRGQTTGGMSLSFIIVRHAHGSIMVMEHGHSHCNLHGSHAYQC
jgi:hypothetical protein